MSATTVSREADLEICLSEAFLHCMCNPYFNSAKLSKLFKSTPDLRNLGGSRTRFVRKGEIYLCMKVKKLEEVIHTVMVRDKHQ